MFDVRADERLNSIQTRAGFIAFCSYWCITLILLILMKIIDGGVLHDPYFVLLIPFFMSMIVFLVMLSGKGFMRTIREEANRSPQQTHETRLRLLLGTLLFATTMFLLKRLDIFDSDAATLGSDMLDSCGMAAVFGAYLWFTQGRKVREPET